MPFTTIQPDWMIRFIRETSVATWAVDGDGYALDIPEWIALTGQTADEAKGDGWMDAIHRDDVERVSAAWRTAVIHQSHYNTDYRLRCADGIYRWFNARGYAILDAEGIVVKWIGVILPIAGTGRFSRPEQGDRLLPASRFEGISPAALRAARALLNWPAERLADEAGVSRSTIRRMEDEESVGVVRKGSIAEILKALAEEGVRCMAHDGQVIGVALSVDPQDAVPAPIPTPAPTPA